MSGPAPAGGLLLVDKPQGLTSHDVVARVRRLAGTRRVGHAGTLDPMATGLLIIGLDKATRLLGHLATHDKDYTGTVRLGARTSTDDAEGELIAEGDAGDIADTAIHGAAATFVGDLLQVPPAVSAIKVGGVRSYTRARRGEDIELAARPARVTAFDVLAVRREGRYVDVDIFASVSSGTYIRALARDLGETLGAGGHLTALRRTRIGSYDISAARPLAEFEAQGSVRDALQPLAAAVAAAFPRRDVDAPTAVLVAHGGRLPAEGIGPGPVGVFGPDGDVLALMEERGDVAAALCVFADS